MADTKALAIGDNVRALAQAAWELAERGWVRCRRAPGRAAGGAASSAPDRERGDVAIGIGRDERLARDPIGPVKIRRSP